ncbi:MAG: ACP S-malonyltransferase [Gammaproteobacteria bacterium]|jgi:[acyl-carrier-protein] S-malonyltransferase|nr:ACP S-malonyltransferase [Gammaproteobacteria bacterium]MBT5203022.1 ACP S-malonyltransferase [Gammaproteobacteria bacterium]MBT5601861.1 ACP S-malonyltransferase [Gammaproteobacteria bacterium]MBT6245595.1 ACP S-malonyltransferase [Gammaproteobacteria bacterium]
MNMTAFVFPGQGSQRVGMLLESKQAVAETFNSASEVLDYDLWGLIQDGPETQLNQTEYTQPALLTASVALWRLWQNTGGTADYLAGHSLGEYAALVASDVLTLQDAVSLVRLRGQLMQSAVPVGEGGMTVIMGLDDDQIAEICRQVDSGTVEAANFNAPGQVVISGSNEAVAVAAEACKQAGAKRVVVLPVSAPFHCSLMAPAAERLQEALNCIEFAVPQIPVIQNVSARVCADPADIKQNLVKQMYAAVRWTECVQEMIALGVASMIECGPGKVLTGLSRRISRDLKTHNLASEADILTLQEGL